MSLAITVQDVSKLYRLGEISRGQLLADARRWWWRRRKARHAALNDQSAQAEPQERSDFWALKDVSFNIKQGETVAIIGANGAGKSTLLKVISRITAPTTGSVRIEGRIGSLLEVGTGFHPELSGRDNVYLNGAILGMSRNEVKSKFDDIVSFAGLEQFIDTPVKRYSSGMYVRLAFSVSAFLEPEILIIDEVLSVGDQDFQNRCMQRMEQIIGDGRTLMFVSHGASLVRRICRRAICLSHGKVIFDGEVNDAMAAYVDSTKQASPPKPSPQKSEQTSLTDLVRDPRTTSSFREWLDLKTAPGNTVVKLRSVSIVNAEGVSAESLSTTESSRIEIEFSVLEGGRRLQPNVLFSDGMGNVLFWSTDTNPDLRSKPLEIGQYKSTMAVPADFLAPGLISITVAVIEITDRIVKHASVSDALFVNVIDDLSEQSIRCGYKGILPGFFRPRMNWTTEPSP
ncbi:MAG: ABC transporter ATP-binding protein [Terrimicrobiaceae bacterium]